MADENTLLAVLGELRPVGGDRCIQIDLPAVGQNMDAQRAQALGDRIENAHGVFVPRTGARVVPMAPPQIDDFFTLVIDANGTAYLAVFGEVALQRFTHGGEGRIAGAINV